jgi:Tat protein translocase TatC
VRSVGIVLAAQIALFAITFKLRVAYEATRVLVLLLYAACSAMTTAMAERRLWPTPIAYFVVATIASFFFAQKYFDFLTRPARMAWTAALGREPVFVFTGPTEPFWVYTKLAMYAALLVSCPFIIWELWKFVAPGLYKKEKRLALLVTAATAVCFMGGAVFGYALISKPALTFLFGLVHGFGFAGALAEISLPASQKPLALLGFNAGVELGQLAVLALVLPALNALSRAEWFKRRAIPALSAAIVIPAMVWFVARIAV